MFPHNHKDITKDALGSHVDPPPCKAVIKQIYRANIDSDFHSGKLPAQHFQEIFVNAYRFYRDNLKVAARILAGHIRSRRSSRETHAGVSTVAYYILGRSLHCLQDFYAHTNYVALGLGEGDTVWDEQYNPDVKLSKMTPSDRAGKNVYYPSPLYLDENLTIKKWARGTMFDGSPRTRGIINEATKVTKSGRTKEKTYRKRHFELMKRQSLDHPDMQLDFLFSYPSKLCKEFLFSKRYGYSIARTCAMKHTRRAWGKFITQLRINGCRQNEINEHLKKDPPKLTNDRLRNFYNKARKSAGVMSFQEL